MSRVLHGIEKGIRLYAENSDSVFIDLLFGAAAPGGDAGEQDAAPLGSAYYRTNGAFYQKIASTNAASDWLLNGNGSSSVVPIFRNIVVRAGTGQALTAGVRNLTTTPFSDDEGTTLAAADFTVGQFVIGGIGGTPILYEVTAVAAPNITLAVATPALQNNDGFIVRSYLPDSGDAQENQALVVYQGTSIIKLADVDWNFATGISLSSTYAAVQSSAAIATGESVESAIQKLDGRSAKRAQAAGITALATVDSVLVDNVKAVKWLVHAFENANPARIKAFEIYATHNGTAAADATQSDDTQFSALKMGGAFNLVLAVDLNGVGVAQAMRLRASSSTAGVTVTARRLEVY